MHTAHKFVGWHAQTSGMGVASVAQALTGRATQPPPMTTADPGKCSAPRLPKCGRGAIAWIEQDADRDSRVLTDEPVERHGTCSMPATSPGPAGADGAGGIDQNSSTPRRPRINRTQRASHCPLTSASTR